MAGDGVGRQLRGLRGARTFNRATGDPGIAVVGFHN